MKSKQSNKSTKQNTKQVNQHKSLKKRDRANFSKTAIGLLDVSKSGMGFVPVLDGEIDIRISPHNFMGALKGDEVEVEILKIGAETGRPEGAVVKIIKRNTTQVIGRIEIAGNLAFLVPSNDKLHTDFFVPMSKLKGAKNNDKVVAGNITWEAGRKNPNAEVLEIIDGVRASDIAMKEIILDAGFAIEFPKEVMQEANKLNDEISKEELSKRKDFRNTFTFTIDPADAKDFDDAISYKVLENGNYEIGIHIADVSHYVQPETALDKEAYTRATSVYLPDRVNPMLPEKISNELCSLRPNEDKLTFSAVFEIDKNAQVKNYWLGRTIIHSIRRYTYEEAQDVIEGANDQYENEIKIINNLAIIMRAERFKNGAINFSSEEVRFVLNEVGELIGIKIKTSKAANQLIEELMLLANKTVGKHVYNTLVNDKPVPFPYRVHDAPDQDKLRTFIAYASKYGNKFNMTDSATIAKSFNMMLENSAGKPERAILETLGIRCMAKAAYTTQNIGHYGLAFEFYCHFTSPIRRYPDVLVHRVLQQVLDKNIIFDKHMETKSVHCSERERKAMHCERDANKYKQVEYLSKHIGEEFEGIITGVAHFGFWVETIAHKCEGLISFTHLSDIDIFKHEPENYCVVGQHTKMKFAMGDQVKIIVANANLDARELDFDLVIARPERIVRTKKKA
jgi:ribonuclease R